MYQLKMIRQTQVRLLAVATLAAAVSAVALVIVLVVPRSESSPAISTEPRQVPAEIVISEGTEAKMHTAGIYILDNDPAYEPYVSLAEVAVHLEQEAGVTVDSGALVMVNANPTVPDVGFLRGTLHESLVWAVSVNTSGSSVPDLFVPGRSTVAFVDADYGGLIGVITH